LSRIYQLLVHNGDALLVKNISALKMRTEAGIITVGEQLGTQINIEKAKNVFICS
jgi:hypothetical protein